MEQSKASSSSSDEESPEIQFLTYVIPFKPGYSKLTSARPEEFKRMHSQIPNILHMSLFVDHPTRKLQDCSVLLISDTANHVVCFKSGQQFCVRDIRTPKSQQPEGTIHKYLEPFCQYVLVLPPKPLRVCFEIARMIQMLVGAFNGRVFERQKLYFGIDGLLEVPHQTWEQSGQEEVSEKHGTMHVRWNQEDTTWTERGLAACRYWQHGSKREWLCLIKEGSPAYLQDFDHASVSVF